MGNQESVGIQEPVTNQMETIYAEFVYACTEPYASKGRAPLAKERESFGLSIWSAYSNNGVHTIANTNAQETK